MPNDNGTYDSRVNTDGFDYSDTASQPIRQNPVSNTDTQLSEEFQWTSHSFAGVTYNDGKEDALKKVISGLNPNDIYNAWQAWDAVHTHIKTIQTNLETARQMTFKSWSGDDADRAQKTWNNASNSVSKMEQYTSGMATGTKGIYDAVTKVTGGGADTPSGLDKAGNIIMSGTIAGPVAALTGFHFGDDGNKAVDEYQTMISKINDARNTHYPSSIDWQVKPSAATEPGQGGVHQGSQTGVSGVGGVNGTGTPQHVNGLNTQHINGTKNLHPTTTNHDTGDDGNDGGTKNVTGPGDDGGLNGLGNNGGGGIGNDGGYTPSHIGTGGSGLGGSAGTLSGYDPGAAGLGGGGVGGGAGGGSFGAGAGGAGSLGGGAGAAGLGASGAGAGVGGAGAGAGAGLAGAGEAGRGGAAGMMPMRGGGGGGNGDDERERSTWLTEDDDVWGNDDETPSVIS